MIIKRKKEPFDDLLVIEEHFSLNGRWFRVLDEDISTPYLLREGEVFVASDERFQRWIRSDSKNETTYTFPEFSSDGFWERYFDDDPEAINLYDAVVVPTSKIAITIENIADPHSFTWSNVRWLLKMKNCHPKMPVALATEKVRLGSENVDEIELAGDDYADHEEIERLVTFLARQDTLVKDQIFQATLDWVLKSRPLADFEIFKHRVKKFLDENLCPT